MTREVDATKESKGKTGVVTDGGHQREGNNIISKYQLLVFFSFNLPQCNLGWFLYDSFFMFLNLKSHVEVAVQRGIGNKNGKEIVVKERFAQKIGK